MQITMAGAQPHWNYSIPQANLPWATDCAEGFITGVVIPAELLHSSRTSPFRHLARVFG